MYIWSVENLIANWKAGCGLRYRKYMQLRSDNGHFQTYWSPITIRKGVFRRSCWRSKIWFALWLTFHQHTRHILDRSAMYMGWCNKNLQRKEKETEGKGENPDAYKSTHKDTNYQPTVLIAWHCTCWIAMTVEHNGKVLIIYLSSNNDPLTLLDNW